VASFDDRTGVPLPADTIEHDTEDALVEAVVRAVAARQAERVIAGLPLLPSGLPGEQVEYVQIVCDRLRAQGIDVVLLDERYSSPRNRKFGDAEAALSLLQTYLDRLLTKDENDIN
jgi:RNase H-fold protein (predicted Holliday junction resolvase)